MRFTIDLTGTTTFSPTKRQPRDCNGSTEALPHMDHARAMLAGNRRITTAAWTDACLASLAQSRSVSQRLCLSARDRLKRILTRTGTLTICQRFEKLAGPYPLTSDNITAAAKTCHRLTTQATRSTSLFGLASRHLDAHEIRANIQFILRHDKS